MIRTDELVWNAVYYDVINTIQCSALKMGFEDRDNIPGTA